MAAMVARRALAGRYRRIIAQLVGSSAKAAQRALKLAERAYGVVEDAHSTPLPILMQDIRLNRSIPLYDTGGLEVSARRRKSEPIIKLGRA